jgi:23S rRNA pseudouridine2605 synthase
MQRLSKLIAAAGVASRRKAADLIRARRVSVDGVVVDHPGTLVDEATAAVAVDGRRVQLEPKVYLLLHKPRGPLSTAADYRGRQTVLDLLGDAEERLYPAGRLDADTEGLLLITNDGDLTFRLTHPSHEVDKVYEADVPGRPSALALRQLEQVVLLEDGLTRPAQVRVLRSSPAGSRLELTIHEGRKRQVKRMLKAVGHPVQALKRTRVGPLTLGDLPVGAWRHLTEEEVEQLRAATEKAAPTAGAAGSGEET